MASALVFSRPVLSKPHPYLRSSFSSNWGGNPSAVLFAARGGYNDDFARGGGGTGDEEKKRKKKNEHQGNDQNSTESSPPPLQEFDDSTNNNDKENNSFEALSAETSVLFKSLKKRQRQLLHINSMKNWRQSKCTLDTRIYLNDFVRRVAIMNPHSLYGEEGEEASLAVCGGSRGGLYLLDLRNGQVLDCVEENVHNAQGEGAIRHSGSSTMEGDAPTKIWKLLYGSFDGGGVVSLAMGQVPLSKYNNDKNDKEAGNAACDDEMEEWVASSGREGGASVWRIITANDDDDNDNDSSDKNQEGTIRKRGKKFSSRIRLDGLTQPSSSASDTKTAVNEDIVVTCLSFDKRGQLWAGCADGKIRVYQFLSSPSSSSSSTIPTLVNTIDIMPSSNSTDECASSSPPILNLYICNDLDCGVCVTAASASDTTARYSGSVHIFSLQNNDNANNNKRSMTKMQPFRDGVHGRSVCLVRNTIEEDDENKNYDPDENSDVRQSKVSENTWSLICGGSDGSLYRIRLNVVPATTPTEATSLATTTTKEKYISSDDDQLSSMDDTRLATTKTTILWSNPFYNDTTTWTTTTTKNKMRPSHTGPVMCLTPHPSGGLFLSGGQDGTVRVWQCNSSSDAKNKSGQHRQTPSSSPSSTSQQPLPSCRYAIFGYKFWLGSICTDGLRLVSDGTDKCIVVRDYSL